MLWYADNSELKGMRDTEMPDMLLFGGVAVSMASEPALRKAVEDVKARYFNARAPVKWNFRDLKGTYEAEGMGVQYKSLLEKSKEWRREVFEVLEKADCTVIISIVRSHSAKKDVIKDVRPDLVRYSFSNGLMRVGLHAQEAKPSHFQVMLDWPERGDSSPFDSEYAAAFSRGSTADKSVPYHCGPLQRLNFADSVGYANMRHSTMLQVADLMVGATREFIECAIGKRETSLGFHLCKLIAPKFRGYGEGRIFGRGISVASDDSAFKKSIREYIAAHLHGTAGCAQQGTYTAPRPPG